MDSQLIGVRNREAVRRYDEKNRDRLNAAERERRATDPEYRERKRARTRKSVDDWKKRHPDQAKAIAKTHYDKNASKYRERARAYYHQNIEARRAYSRMWHTKNRDTVLASMKHKGQLVKAEVLNNYGGLQCSCCGESQMAFLTIDHINGCGVKKRKEEGVGVTFYRRLIRLGFPTGYQVLCFNCNCGRRVNGGQCPHKTTPISAI